MKRNPLSDNEAERICLGAAIENQGALDLIRDRLTLESFDMGKHRYIWDALEVLWRASHRPSSLDVIQQLEFAENLDRAGGADYVFNISDEGRGIRLEVYINRVQEAQKRRRLDALARKLHQEAPGEEIDDIISETAKELGDISSLTSEEPAWLEDIYLSGDPSLFDDFGLSKHNRDRGIMAMAGPSCGFSEIDEFIGGLGPSRLVIVGARAGVGKTEFLSHMIAGHAKHQVPCVAFSMEMSRKEYAARISGPLIRVHGNRSLSGKISGEEAERHRELQYQLKENWNKSVLIDARSALTCVQIKAVTRRHIEKDGVKVIYIDHMGLIRDRSKNPYERMSAISRDLKEIAMSLNVCVVAACQVNRAGDEKPMLYHLRDSGSIEQDADQVMLVSRKTDGNDSIWSINLAKNRHGSQREFKYLYEYSSATVTPYVTTEQVRDGCLS